MDGRGGRVGERGGKGGRGGGGGGREREGKGEGWGRKYTLLHQYTLRLYSNGKNCLWPPLDLRGFLSI
jgi:hypothetical protein